MTIIPDFGTLANPKLAFYLMAVTLMTASYAALWRIVNSRLGHLCRSLQQNEELAASIGVNTAYLRVLAYSISSFFGGIAGASFVAISQSVYPSSFQVADSVNFMLNCFLGGLGFVFGPMLGTLLLYFGWDLLFAAGKYQMLIYSSLLIAAMLVLPNGLLSLPDPEPQGSAGNERHPPGQGRDQALWRADRRQRGLLRRRRARDPLGDRPQRRGKIDAVQADLVLREDERGRGAVARRADLRTLRRMWWRARASCGPSRKRRSSGR